MDQKKFFEEIAAKLIIYCEEQKIKCPQIKVDVSTWDSREYILKFERVDLKPKKKIWWKK